MVKLLSSELWKWRYIRKNYNKIDEQKFTQHIHFKALKSAETRIVA